jgi:hypothetical protein
MIRFGFARAAACSGTLAVALLLTSPASGTDDGFADEVISYDEGSNPAFGYVDPAVALGSPERFTGEGWTPMIVSAMNPPWRPAEVVSIGNGGHLTLRFDAPVTDDPLNPFGIDLLVFGNALLIDAHGGELDGICGEPAAISSEGGVIEVSLDGETWTLVPEIDADGLFPTEGYLDHDSPYATEPGEVESDFLKPVNPARQLSDFDGQPYADVLMIYQGSGGGAGIDIGALGLAEISYVRISNPDGGFDSPEIDAIADVAAVLPGDVNGDWVVDVSDLLALLESWGNPHPHGWDADFNGDAAVDVSDLLLLLSNWE